MSTPDLDGPDPLSDDFGMEQGSETTPEASEPSEPLRPYEAQTTEPQSEPQVKAETEGEQLLAGRFKDITELEKAYKEAQGWGTRQQQQLLAQQQEMLALRRQSEETQKLLGELVPYFQQQVVAEDPEAAERMALLQELQPLIQQQVEPMRQQLAAEQAKVQAERIVAEFRQKHPDVPAGGREDFEVAQVVQELNLVHSDPEALDIAYEAWKDPSLRTVLRANPALIDTDEGMTYARAQARALFGSSGGGAATSSQATPGMTPSQPARQAFVETGGTGTPASAAPGKRSGDEFDEAFDAWAAEKKSPLFGGLFQSSR
jgi:hypothetical protein